MSQGQDTGDILNQFLYYMREKTNLDMPDVTMMLKVQIFTPLVHF